MKNLLLGCLFLNLLHILQCLSQGKEPSLGEYFLEAVDLMNRTQWRYFLPDDTDIDQDGNLSDLEVQHKFNSYMAQIFNLVDHNKDKSITEDEFRSFKIDIEQLANTVVDIGLENFPLKPFFLAADGNGDSFYDEDDFYVPATIQDDKVSENGAHQPQTDVEIIGFSEVKYRGEGVAKIGHNEGIVICKSLGFDGLERIVGAEEVQFFYKTSLTFSCDGNEARLEECQSEHLNYRNNGEAMGVVCQGSDKLGNLRLVGGKDASSGDIFFGEKGIGCGYHTEANSAVICRELGFSGFLKKTYRSRFSKTYHQDNKILHKEFNCKGNEENLEDCPQSDGKYCSGWFVGVICKTGNRTGVDPGLSDLIGWEYNDDIWENYGRFLHITDNNGDGKFSLEEVANKAKELMTNILEFLDGNHDRKISLEDFTSPRFSINSIHGLMTELFNGVTAGQGEIDIYNMKIAGQDMSNIWGSGLKTIDWSKDKRINAVDFFGNQAPFLLPMLSQKLDRNQDGKIQREELKQFTDDIFKYADIDKNGILTLQDVYNLLRENGLDCLQVGALKSYIKVLLDMINKQTRDFMSYIFRQFDINGNGHISPKELEKIQVPCDIHGRYSFYDFESNDDTDLNLRLSCPNMFYSFFGRITDFVRQGFPDLEFNSRRHSARIRIVDKMSIAACNMLT